MEEAKRQKSASEDSESDSSEPSFDIEDDGDSGQEDTNIDDLGFSTDNLVESHLICL